MAPTTSRVRRHATDLQRLVKAKAVTRKRMLSGASQSLILALVDIAKSLIRGELSMTPRQLSAARRSRRQLHGLAQKGVSVEKKRRVLVQDGNLIGLLLKPLIQGIGPIVSGLLGGLGGIGGGGRRD